MFKYEKGKIVSGCVTGVENYGVFVGLDEFYCGLIHISEISNTFVKDINDYVSVGETIRVKVVDVDEENYHIKLSIKDINYRVNYRNRSPIIEVGSGFDPLKKQLRVWMNQKKDKK
ncbi:MAG: S1 RNA-binding domain-containing protein [bacterium]|nr:S1 RNA-binding domain-containing protein [bacterium]